MQAALDLANGGIKVYLAERGPAIGGVMAQLDKTFPTNDCAMCTMAPRLVEIGRHKDIEILTLSEVERVEGQPGNFTVSIKQQPRFIDATKCTGCGACTTDCPVTGRAEGDLPAVSASGSQYLQHFTPRELSLRGWMSDPSECTGLCDADRARTLRGGTPGHSARQSDSINLRPHLHASVHDRLHPHQR
jgi:heterodisulfide reductase subunit A